MTDDERLRVHVTWLPDDDAEASVVLQLVRAASGVDDARLARMCRSCGSDRHGKPEVVVPAGRSPVFVSLSRSGGRTVVAITRSGPIGVDVEACPRAGTTSSELVEWVRTESLVKATGHGLTIDPAEIDESRHTIDLDAPDGFVAAVTILTNGPSPVLSVTEG
ncbi:4'-phosphopantetheinyl transferase family protein [Aeromicrobium fastidiosum]|uniref:Uncharacterized protein n=1 Tax=Aeromicrobium fastidiosum TaxID=52699 RepID=A0A641AQX8_9ACTN|nr:hypothetical protein [Aeromicrobium fastidiosum]KAA1378492.1 hypothetical protein ESP62_009065 [Aeromicrobium fastidiosum]MBP2392543.1 4'-phosphopantetheinyl transferase [Aeromicrobium fastidiosum]